MARYRISPESQENNHIKILGRLILGVYIYRYIPRRYAPGITTLLQKNRSTQFGAVDYTV